MRDQVEVLQRKGVKAANLDSTLGTSESITVKNGVRTGDIKILYIAPERSAFCAPLVARFTTCLYFTGSTTKVLLR